MMAVRITLSLDEGMGRMLEKMVEETRLSRSALLRMAINFYSENRQIAEGYFGKKVLMYFDMLSSGEHVILDINHFLLFLQTLEASPKQESFWNGCKLIAKAHAEQLAKKIRTPKLLLERLEACNFFRINQDSEDEYTLILNSQLAMKFVKSLIEDFATSMGFRIDVKEDLAKIRVNVHPDSRRGY